jgi:hypothetical protein
VPDPETKPQPKRKKKSIKYKIETKAIKQIKKIKHIGTSPTNLPCVGSHFTGGTVKFLVRADGQNETEKTDKKDGEHTVSHI